MSWDGAGLATTTSSLQLRISSPTLPATPALSLVCTASIERAWSRSSRLAGRLDMTVLPVLGKPLTSPASPVRHAAALLSLPVLTLHNYFHCIQLQC